MRPLAVRDPHHLYQIRLQPWTSFKLLTTSYPAFEDIRQRNTVFSEVAAFNGYAQARLKWGHFAKNASGQAVTGNYFEMLGIKPQIGRLFRSADERGPRSAPFVVLSDKLWRSAFDANPGVVGMTVQLDKESYTMLGVASADFHGTEQFVWPDFWIPIVNWAGDSLQNRASPVVTVLGRLKPGVSPTQAAENLSVIAAQLAVEYPKTDTGVPLRLVPAGLYGDDAEVIRGFLYGVTILGLLVLIAACANLASLFAARAADRRRELAVRVALGASRAQLVRQLFIEALALALLAGTAGLTGASLLIGALNRWQTPYGHLAVSVDARVYGAALGCTLLSALLFGLIPAWQAWQSSPLQAMKGGRSEAAHRRSVTLQDLLLGAQIAICTLLVLASLVAVRGMIRALSTPFGFQPQGATLAEMDLDSEESETTLDAKKAMIEAIRHLPGITAAGSVNRVPFTGGLRGVPVFPPGTTEFSLNNSVLSPYVFVISPGYLEAAVTRLLTGRDVSWRDTLDSPCVAVVNSTFARKMWGDAPAVGQRFIVQERLTEVVGVVETGRYHNMQESPQPAVYLPLSQNEQGHLIFVARSARAQSEVAGDLERTLTGLAPDVPVTVQSWREALGGLNALFPARAATHSLCAMGLLAATLAITGIFGLSAYNVSRRMKELGIRVALGAQAKHILRAAVGRSALLLALGTMLGLFMGALASRGLGRIVFEANPREPIVVMGAILVMALLGIVAAAIPALRALAVDPSKLLRED